MLSKVMQGLGIASQIQEALSGWQSPPDVIEMLKSGSTATFPTIGVSTGTGEAAAATAAKSVPGIGSVIMAGEALYKMFQSRGEGNKPFVIRQLRNLKDRDDDAGKTARKFLEAGFDERSTIQQLFSELVKNPQDYYAFRDEYFVGDFDTATFRKDFGLTDDNFFPVEEPEHVS
jgi:hypothetical protein